MIHLLFGQDSYSSTKDLKTLIQEHIQTHQDINYAKIDGKSLDSLKDISNELSTPAFLSDKKMIVIHNFLSQNKKKTIKEDYIAFLKKINIHANPEIELIHYENTADVDKRQALYKYLKKEGTIKEYANPDSKSASSWVRSMVASHNMAIEENTIESLVTAHESIEYWQLESDIKKLVLYAKHHNETMITEKMVDTCISKGIATKVFDLTDAIAKKKKQKAFFLLSHLLKSGENVFMILGTLAYQIRTLLKLKILQDKGLDHKSIISVTKLHPFVVNKNKYQTQYFETQKLKDLIHNIAHTEYTLKSKDVDIELTLIKLLDTCMS